ncbi:hypothetical protein DHW03_08655 [Pedobacter yonginense]|uniref:Uncharacterized protein n=1 Tax=Pedobacter yonginense TaxID=651869 RepID=A0A317EQR0_9SPHI|nr:hypothetical protein DHW03_08655 [Pedobacter yonginense]
MLNSPKTKIKNSFGNERAVILLNLQSRCPLKPRRKSSGYRFHRVWVQCSCFATTVNHKLDCTNANFFLIGSRKSGAGVSNEMPSVHFQIILNRRLLSAAPTNNQNKKLFWKRACSNPFEFAVPLSAKASQKKLGLPLPSGLGTMLLFCNNRKS